MKTNDLILIIREGVRQSLTNILHFSSNNFINNFLYFPCILPSSMIGYLLY
jgi:hypothetical protein